MGHLKREDGLKCLKVSSVCSLATLYLPTLVIPTFGMQSVWMIPVFVGDDVIGLLMMKELGGYDPNNSHAGVYFS